MKVKRGHIIKTYCNVCGLTLRDDYIRTKIQKETYLYHSVFHMGDNRHKCKKCFKNGFKSKWRYIMNPLKRV